MQLLSIFPTHYNVVLIFGLTLLLGLICGELAKLTRVLPRITGYLLVGCLLGPSILNLVTPSVLIGSRIFVDAALGLILFNIGKYLDFTWIRNDPSILLMSLAETSITFTLVFISLFLFNMPPLQAALAATIAVTTSPAIIMLVADELHAKGPVTRRTLILTSLNNIIGLTIFTFLLPFLTQQHTTLLDNTMHAIHRMLFSILLGGIICYLTFSIAYLVGKRKENQFILLVGSVMLAIGLAIMFDLSSLLTLFTFGIITRNFDFKNIMTEVDLGWLAKLFFIILFVISGVYLQFSGFYQAFWIILTFLIARTIGKFSGILLLSKASRLTRLQSWSIGLALMPMASLAIGMSNIIYDLNPDLGRQLFTVIISIITILNLIGPIATQLAFMISGETMRRKRARVY